MGLRVKAVGQGVMQWNLHHPRGYPNRSQERKAGKEPRIAIPGEYQQDRGSQLGEHQRPNHQGDEPSVPLVVTDELITSNLAEQRIVNDLDGPDQAHQGPSSCVMKMEDAGHRCAITLECAGGCLRQQRADVPSTRV